MTKDQAWNYLMRDHVSIARAMVNIMDDDFRKKKEETDTKIKEHKEAIAKLEDELSKYKGEAIKKYLPLAKRKQNEAWKMLSDGDRVLDGTNLWEDEEL